MQKTAIRSGRAMRWRSRWRTCITQTLLVMKLTIVLIVCTLLQARAAIMAQSVTLSGKDLSLKAVFSAIKEQTGYVVFSQKGVLERTHPVTVSAEEMPLSDFLALVLKGQPVNYTISGYTITLAEKKTPQAFVVPAGPITGRVLDKEGNVLAGATVKVKGTRRVAITDSRGGFSIEAADGEILQVTYTGYTMLEVPIGSTSSVTLMLTKSDSRLNEVQVVAYGTTTKRFNTGSVTTIRSEEIERQPVNNPLLALQGRVPGVDIRQTNGMAGSPVKVQIRGQNSLRNTNGGLTAGEPLFVIDGLPYNNTIPGLGGSVDLYSFSAFSLINPADIASIDILKDGDATAMYGSRGANGVVLITTKKGQVGAARVTADYSTGWGQITKKVKLMNTEQYIAMRKEAYQNDGQPVPTVVARNNFDLTVWDQHRYTDWQEVLIGGTARYNTARATVEGGTQTIQYIISGNYSKETTVFPGNQFDQKAGAHFSLTGSSADKRFVSRLTGSFMHNNSEYRNFNYARDIYLPPNAPAMYNEDGSLNWEPIPFAGNPVYPTWSNPARAALTPYEKAMDNLISNLDISYRLLPGLTLKALVSYGLINGDGYNNTPIASSAPGFLANAKGGAAWEFSHITNFSVEPYIQYNGNISRGKLEATLVASYQHNTTEKRSMLGVEYNNDELLHDITAAGNIYGGNEISEYKYNAISAHLGYNWEGKYIINLRGRRDGSSRFGPGNQFGNFGSVGAAWIFSEEPFMRASLLSFGKLRFSYGTTGNESIGDYQYMELYGGTNPASAYQGVKGLITSGLYNPYYAWEVTRKMELALEGGFFKDRLLFSVASYRNRSSNQLVMLPLPSISGPGSLLANSPALIQNMGLEVTLNTVNMDRQHFRWTTAFNISFNRDKLLDFPDLESSPYATDFVVGRSFTEYRYYKFAGLDPATGTFRFQKKDGTLTDLPDYMEDRIVGRSLQPQFQGGLSNNFTYKAFTLDLTLQYYKGLGCRFFRNGLPGYYFFGSISNQPASILDRWQKPGDVSQTHKFTTNYAAYGDPFYRAEASDYMFLDASYIRLKNVYLAYRLPASLQRKIGMKGGSIYLQAQNLLTITGFAGGDPETAGLTPNGGAPLPPLRVVNAGIQITL